MHSNKKRPAILQKPQRRTFRSQFGTEKCCLVGRRSCAALAAAVSHRGATGTTREVLDPCGSATVIRARSSLAFRFRRRPDPSGRSSLAARLHLER